MDTKILFLPQSATNCHPNDRQPTGLQLYQSLREKLQVLASNPREEALRLYIFHLSKQDHSKEAALTSATSQQWKIAADEMIKVLRLKHRAMSTEKIYKYWLRQFHVYIQGKPPAQIDAQNIRNFMSFLAVERNVAASTQNQAFNAILFFSRHILDQDIENISNAVRAKRKRKLPVVLSKNEVKEIFKYMEGVYLLIVKIIYGGGLRKQECLNLRIKDLDFENGNLTIRSGKGEKDRVTILPTSINDELTAHLESLKKTFHQDRSKDIPGVFLPGALERKYPNAGKEWAWQ